MAALDGAFDPRAGSILRDGTDFLSARRAPRGNRESCVAEDSPMDFPVRCDEPGGRRRPRRGFSTAAVVVRCSIRRNCASSAGSAKSSIRRMWKTSIWATGRGNVDGPLSSARARGSSTGIGHDVALLLTASKSIRFLERNYLRFLIHAVGPRPLFRRLWLAAIRRLQLQAMEGSGAAWHTLRSVPRIGPRPAQAAGACPRPRSWRSAAAMSPFFRPGTQEIGHGRRQPLSSLPAFARWRRPHLQPHEACGTRPGSGSGGVLRSINHPGTGTARSLQRNHSASGAEAATTGAIPCVPMSSRSSIPKRSGLPSNRPCRQWRPAVVQLEFTQMAQYAADCHPGENDSGRTRH